MEGVVFGISSNPSANRVRLISTTLVTKVLFCNLRPTNTTTTTRSTTTSDIGGNMDFWLAWFGGANERSTNSCTAAADRLCWRASYSIPYHIANRAPPGSEDKKVYRHTKS